jgi:tape measure domain-containing protein
VADLGDMIARLLLDASDWMKGLTAAEEKTAEATAGMQGALEGMGESISKVGSALAELGMAEAIKDFAADAIQASAEVAKFRVQIENLKGSGEATTEFLDKIHELAETSPFSFPELSGTAERMVALGVSLDTTSAAMESIVQMGTALRMSSEQVNTIANSMARMSAGSDVMRSMNQMVREGVPVWQMLAASIGTDVPTAQAKVKDGSLSVNQVIGALTEQMGQYSEAAAAWGNTFAGKTNELQKTVHGAMVDIGDSIRSALNDIGVPIFNALIGVVKEAKAAWDGLSTPVKDAILAFGGAFAAISALGGVIALLGAAVTAIGGPFILAAAAIGAVIAALVGLGVWIGEHWGPISEILAGTWESIKAIWGDTWDAIVIMLKIIWETLATDAKSVWDATVAVLTGIWDVIKAIWTGVWTAIVFALQTGWNTLKASLSIFDAILGFLLPFWDPIMAAFKKAWDTITGWLTAAWDKLKTTANLLTSAFGGITKELEKQVPAADAAKDAHKALTPHLDDNADRSTKLAAAQKEVADKFKMTHDAALVLTDILNIYKAQQSALASDVAKFTVKQTEMAAAHKTVGDNLAAIVAPTTSEANAMDDLSKKTAKFFEVLNANTGTIQGAQAALKEMGVQSSMAAESAAEHAQELEREVNAAGDMSSEADKLAAYANTLRANIDALSRTTGDNSEALEVLRAELQATEDAMNNMAKTTTDAYHEMGLKTQAELDRTAAVAKQDYEQIAADAGSNSLAAQQAWIKAEQAHIDAVIAAGGTVTEAEKAELDKRKVMLQNEMDSEKSQWLTTYEDVKKGVGKAFDDMVNMIVTGKGSFSDIMQTMFQDLAKAALKGFIDPFAKAVENFIATTIADLLSGKGLGGVLDSLKQIGSTATDVFKGAGGGVPSVPGGGGEEGGIPSIPGGGAGGAGGGGGLGGFLGSSLFGNILSAGTLVSSIIGNFQSARMETTMNAVEHNTRYTMMYVGERADGGILGQLFKMNEELAFGNIVVAVEDLRNKFFDWTGFINPVLETTRNLLDSINDTVIGFGPYIADTKDAAVATASNTANIVAGLQSLQVSVVATGATTEAAAKALGDQIAVALSRQLVPAT